MIFERFLNPDRISTRFWYRFLWGKRDQVFEYLKTKYKNGVAHIITFGKLKARMVLRDVGRVVGLSYGHVDRICKMVPFDPSRPLSLQESIFEGLSKYGNACSWSSYRWRKIGWTIPLYMDHSSNLTLPSTQYDMYSSENAGLVKFDLLGLKTLTVIDNTIKRLKLNKTI